MTYAQGLTLGLVQGITEFLPVSSSGHLILVPHVFGWPDQGLAVDAALHLGTLAALLAYFRRELVALVTGAIARRVALLVLVATIPGGGAGLLLGKLVEARLRVPLLIAASTGVWALVMWLADRRARGRAVPSGEPLERVTWGQAVSVGVAQALALIPGTSRSGITITAGLFGGLDRATAARLSFMLGIPITAAAGLWKALHLARGDLPPGDTGPVAVALLASFASGWFAVWFLVGYLKRRSLTLFVVYRLALMLAIVALAPPAAHAQHPPAARQPPDALDCPIQRTLDMDFRGDGRRHIVELRRCTGDNARSEAMLVREMPVGVTVLRFDNFDDPDAKFLEAAEALLFPDGGGRPELLVIWRLYGTGGFIEWCLLGWDRGALRCRQVDDVDTPAGRLLAADEDFCCKGWNVLLLDGRLLLERPVYRKGDPSCCPTRGNLFVQLDARDGRLAVDRVWRQR
ncbi:MAG: undecaprenyl-diphosphate phosphatase [Candidatus Rokuibacteriota bacterium]